MELPSLSAGDASCPAWAEHIPRRPPKSQMGCFPRSNGHHAGPVSTTVISPVGMLGCPPPPQPLAPAGPNALGPRITQESMCHSDPFVTCIMQPSPAPSLMNLQRAVPCSHTELPDLQNLSSPLESHLASVLAPLSGFQSSADPFQGSALSGFGLPAVGTALAALLSREQPAHREILLCTLVRTGGGDRPKKVPKDHVEHSYKKRRACLPHPFGQLPIH